MSRRKYLPIISTTIPTLTPTLTPTPARRDDPEPGKFLTDDPRRMSTPMLLRKIREIERPVAPRVRPVAQKQLVVTIPEIPEAALEHIVNKAERAVEKKLTAYTQARSAEAQAAKVAARQKAAHERSERKASTAVLASELQHLRKSPTVTKKIIRDGDGRISHTIESLPGGSVKVHEVVRGPDKRLSEIKETVYAP